MKRIAYFLRNPSRYFKNNHNQRLFILASSIFLFLCLIIVLARSKGQREEAARFDNTPTSPISANPTVTPTKWWITATSNPSVSEHMTPTASTGLSISNCSELSSLPLKLNTYAYVSLAPPLPNRIRSSASLSSSYVGQIYPGSGLWIIDGGQRGTLISFVGRANCI